MARLITVATTVFYAEESAIGTYLLINGNRKRRCLRRGFERLAPTRERLLRVRFATRTLRESC